MERTDRFAEGRSTCSDSQISFGGISRCKRTEQKVRAVSLSTNWAKQALRFWTRPASTCVAQPAAKSGRRTCYQAASCRRGIGAARTAATLSSAIGRSQLGTAAEWTTIDSCVTFHVRPRPLICCREKLSRERDLGRSRGNSILNVAEPSSPGNEVDRVGDGVSGFVPGGFPSGGDADIGVS